MIGSLCVERQTYNKRNGLGEVSELKRLGNRLAGQLPIWIASDELLPFLIAQFHVRSVSRKLRLRRLSRKEEDEGRSSEYAKTLVKLEEGVSLVERICSLPREDAGHETRRSTAQLLPAMRASSPGALVAPGLSKSLMTP